MDNITVTESKFAKIKISVVNKVGFGSTGPRCRGRGRQNDDVIVWPTSIGVPLLSFSYSTEIQLVVPKLHRFKIKIRRIGGGGGRVRYL